MYDFASRIDQRLTLSSLSPALQTQMSAVFLGTLLILLVASKCHAFADKAELQTALNAYCANEADATATYGAIGTWDVRAYHISFPLPCCPPFHYTRTHSNPYSHFTAYLLSLRCPWSRTCRTSFMALVVVPPSTATSVAGT